MIFSELGRRICRSLVANHCDQFIDLNHYDKKARITVNLLTMKSARGMLLLDLISARHRGPPRMTVTQLVEEIVGTTSYNHNTMFMNDRHQLVYFITIGSS